MKKWCWFLSGVMGLLLLTGCVSTSPEYFDELTPAEQAELLNSARVLALQGKAVPAHLQGVFLELTPHQRIVYDGNKHGKASFRWEIYDSPRRKGNSRITEKDVNPYWVMVYAIGDLTDPQWKLTHAREDETLQDAPQPPRRGDSSGRPAEKRSRPRQFQEVRYKN